MSSADVTDSLADVRGDGTVILGRFVTCDGFQWGRPVRIQTHVHDDHMAGFDRSKGHQVIFLTRATRELLITESNADLPYRSNLRVIEPGKPFPYKDEMIEIEYSNHMLGAVQVAVQTANGYRVSYSSDFDWPLPRVLEADALVIDATYGAEEFRRDYSRDEVRDRFIDLVLEKLKSGPVYIKAYRGRLLYGAELLRGVTSVPFIGTPKQSFFAEVYRRYGHDVGQLLPDNSDSAQHLIGARERYIGFYELRESKSVPQVERGYVVTLSTYMVPRDDPVKEYSERSCRVALTDHADFDGTLEYVRASKAKQVIVDNSRGGDAQGLAQAIRYKLGISARVASHEETKEWGG